MRLASFLVNASSGVIRQAIERVAIATSPSAATVIVFRDRGRDHEPHDDSLRLFSQGLDQIIHLAPKSGPVIKWKKGIVVTLTELERRHPGRN